MSENHTECDDDKGLKNNMNGKDKIINVFKDNSEKHGIDLHVPNTYGHTGFNLESFKAGCFTLEHRKANPNPPPDPPTSLLNPDWRSQEEESNV